MEGWGEALVELARGGYAPCGSGGSAREILQD